jgi:hypothetical protein
MKVVLNGEGNLLHEGILERSTVCENLTKLVYKWLKKEPETTRREDEGMTGMESQHRGTFFYVYLFSNR